MKLDRNETPDGGGKYALVNMREIRRIGGVARNPDIAEALRILELNGLLDYGNVGTAGEFFVMKLKDKFAYKGLMGYRAAVLQEDPADVDYAQDIHDMAVRAGPNNPNCKFPD